MSFLLKAMPDIQREMEKLSLAHKKQEEKAFKESRKIQEKEQVDSKN